MRRKEKPEIEIDLDDIKVIMGNDFVHFQSVVENCFCSQCSESNTTIVNYKAYLNDLDDIVLRGKCITCGSPVGRYIETGEQLDAAKRADQIRSIKVKLKRS